MQDEFTHRTQDEEDEDTADSVHDEQSGSGTGQAATGTEEQPVPIAPPIAIICSWRGLRLCGSGILRAQRGNASGDSRCRRRDRLSPSPLPVVRRGGKCRGR